MSMPRVRLDAMLPLVVANDDGSSLVVGGECDHLGPYEGKVMERKECTIVEVWRPEWAVSTCSAKKPPGP